MSSRRNNNQIRGPQSALTDFLAANNISAQQIRNSYHQRLARAAQQGATPSGQEESDGDAPAEAPARRGTKRKREDEKKEKEKEKAKSKAKHKAAQKSKRKKKRDSDDDDDDDDSDFEDDSADLGKDMYRKAKPVPGQLDNCETCNKRFTVTAYSKTGPEGGLLCLQCSKEIQKEEKAATKKPKEDRLGKNRRKLESNKLDGEVRVGAMSLQDLCVRKVADHALDIEEFGDLPEKVMERLSKIFSKRRVLDDRTFRLFLRPDVSNITVHECAKLEVDDYMQIFSITPHVTRLVLENAGQFKDSVFEYMLEKADHLKHIQLYAANLVSDEMWLRFFQKYGPQLETVKLQWLDAAFDDETVECMVRNCPNISRLKFKYCRRLTSESLMLLKSLPKLAHASLQLSQPALVEQQLDEFIEARGAGLETLSLEGFFNIGNTTMSLIGQTCKSLRKLRLTDLDDVTDATIAELFTRDNDKSLPPLTFLDLSSVRHMDSAVPEGHATDPIGVCSSAFTSIMAHSGQTLKRLEVPSCRHIDHSAFCDAFSAEIKYPLLEELNISFCDKVDTSVVNGIFRCCPQLKKVVAFGCFKIEDVKVPAGVALIGVPKAQDAIERFSEIAAAPGAEFAEQLNIDDLGRLVEVGA